ncbi:Trp biosynthesis-associated membrane protein [Geodermatophilus sabuli]|uniref:Trp biosynthesis-associated membrane protein n=1 Tax=Geodermatophilus sabuli TaxID=1564158 RepID=UPI001FE78EC2|nr:Trp biosynthesis-associated membrane protein [Geodermatophilus sabuli]
MTAPPGRARRELTLAVAGAALAGGLALSVGGQTWITATLRRPAPLPPTTTELTGGTLAPLVPAGGLLLLAAAVALLAVRGAGRVAVGLLVAVAGGVLGWSGMRALLGDADVAAAAVVGTGSPGRELTAELHAAWPVLALLAGVLAVLAGLLTVLRGRGWPGMGRRYERTPSSGEPVPARPRTDEDRAVDAWRALDRGEDPTDPGGREP